MLSLGTIQDQDNHNCFEQTAYNVLPSELMMEGTLWAVPKVLTHIVHPLWDFGVTS